MNTKQLKYVLVLADKGTFSRAAEALGISQPSLSQYIKKIESQIGAQLFDRTNGDVRLTDAGRVYIEAGRKILDLEHQMEARFSDIVAMKTGSLIVGVSPFRAAAMMPAIAGRFQQLYPGMHLVVREGMTAEVLERMEHGEYDLCLTILPVDKRLFTYEKVMEEEMVLAVPATGPKFNAETVEGRKYAAIDAREIDGQGFVTLTEAQFMNRALENLCADHHLTIFKAAEVNSLETQIAMVRAGIGMALVPTGIERFCSENEVRFYSFRQELPKREVIVMWRNDRNLSHAALELKKVIHEIEW